MTDIRLKQTSYSSLLDLHSCPRKYQLNRLKSIETGSFDEFQQLTFDTGHAVGAGIAEVFMGLSEDEIIWRMFLNWKSDLLAYNPKQNKSFFLSVIAMQKLLEMRKQGFLSDWEVVTYNGKPAAELSFIIHFPDGYVYRGFVDVVLRNKKTSKIMVLECKTSSAYELSAAMYKNSAQAIGYSVVLDSILPEISTYEVMYLVYRTKHMIYEPLSFPKSYLARALWIKELLMDMEIIKMYDAANVFPTHGESCRAWNRDCEYFGICGMSTESLTKQLKEGEEKKILEAHADFEISVTVHDLISAQLAKEVPT